MRGSWSLLNERAPLRTRIGKLKKTLGLEVYQPEREAQVLHHVRSHGRQTGSPFEGMPSHGCSNASSTRRAASSAPRRTYDRNRRGPDKHGGRHGTARERSAIEKVVASLVEAGRM